MLPVLTEFHRVIRIDLVGHGRSGAPEGGDYGLATQSGRVAAALDARGVRRAIMVGHSIGGLVVTAIAEQRPDLVIALVLVSTGPHIDAFIRQGSAIGPDQWPLTDQLVREVVGAASSYAGFDIPQHVVEDVHGMAHHAFTATAEAALDYLRQRSLPERLHGLGKPILVVFGDEDRRWLPSAAADYRAVADAEVEMLPGVGHSPLLEHPLGTAFVLLEFTGVHVPWAD